MTAQEELKQAVNILSEKGFMKLTAKQRTNLLIAFARKNRVLYSQAFDLIKCVKDINLDDESDISANLDSIVVYEVKSTGRRTKKGTIVLPDFSNYFFGLTTGELLVAQNLHDQYRFVFVNRETLDIIEMNLHDILAKAKNIYPQWSIRF